LSEEEDKRQESGPTEPVILYQETPLLTEYQTLSHKQKARLIAVIRGIKLRALLSSNPEIVGYITQIKSLQTQLLTQEGPDHFETEVTL